MSIGLKLYLSIVYLFYELNFVAIDIQLLTKKCRTYYQLCKGILSCAGKITGLEIFRYTEISYRSLQRFLADAETCWAAINFQLFYFFVWKKDKIFVFAADEVIEPKSGKKTFAISHFYSNLQKKVIPSVAHMAISIIDVGGKKSYPLAVKQIVKPITTDQKKTTTIEKSTTKKRTIKKNVIGKTGGRPKGSKNKPKTRK